ncbi:uncharacterized protein BDV17DRAFT_291382 [Aspergillus undulatus]|uniref:uncharacterized protein n=1 Tax=Aspergillus undulatus TaxID=1810928 RepID=UPI003CCD6C65
MSTVRDSRKWYHIRWFADQDILKLDALIVPYAFLAYWVKYVVQANINNAYISGLQEDLKLHGNELVEMQTCTPSVQWYATSRLNELGAISPALGIFYTLFICFASDLVLGPAWAITVAHVWNIIGLTILVTWNVPESALWFAFVTTYSAVSMSSVLYGRVNEQLRYSPVERSMMLVILNTIAQSTTAWTPLLVFKTVEGPRFTKGYPFVLANAICLTALAHIIKYYIARQDTREAAQHAANASDSDDTRDPESSAVITSVEPRKADSV